MPDLDNGLTYPQNSDAANEIGSYIETLARDVRNLYVPDLQVNRPAAGKPGRIFYASDTGLFFLDLGTTWVQVNGAYLTLASQRSLLAPLVYGMRHYATDTGDWSSYLGGGVWSADGSESRIITSPGAAVAANTSAARIGAVNVRGPVSWSLASFGGYGDGLIRTNTAGRYRITAKIQIANKTGPDDVVVRVDRFGSVTETLDQRSSPGYDFVSLQAIELMQANDSLAFTFYCSPGNTATVSVRQVVIERLGW